MKSLTEVPLAALNRIAEVAKLSADDETLQVMRYALQNEFHAYLTLFFNPYRNHSRPWLSARARSFLSGVLDPQYLGLEGLQLVGATSAESIALSMQALDAVNHAIDTLKTCTWGSWDRIEFLGQISKRCFGGFAKGDLERLQTLGSSALSTLADLRQQAEVASTAVDSVGDRNLRDLDFSFTREEMKILGSELAWYPGNSGTTVFSLSSQGIAFMEAIFDPASLNIATATLHGATVTEAQANARAAIAAVNRAEKRIRYCIFDGGGL